MAHNPPIECGRREFLALACSSIALPHLNSAGRAYVSTPPSTDELTALSLKQASELIRKKEVTSVELTEACLRRIDKYEPVLNAFITVSREMALAEAREMDGEIKRRKWRGPLHGIPIALKDNIDTAGVRTTAASLLFAERVPTEDAEVVRRLRSAGAVILGKLNMLVFAGSSVSTYYKPAINPWAPDRFTTGSSSGAGVAVISEMCYGAVATDTRGSIRGPAGVMSVVGLRPTYGRVSNRGVIPLSWTLDTVGPMARTVEDAALMLQAIAGYDAADPTSVDMPVPDYLAGMKAETKKLRLGFARVPYYDDLSPEFLAATDAAFAVLKDLTATSRDINLPAVEGLASITDVETLAYHSQWYPKYKTAYPARWIPYFETTAKIPAADYAKALADIQRLRREIGKVFENVDVVVTPARRSYTGKLEDVLKAQASPDATAEAGFNYTAPFSVFGLPAMNVPCGFTKAGLPVAIQIIGRHWGEEGVFALGHAYEHATEWHKRRPPLAI